MEQIGYALVDEANTEIACWGDSIGQCAGMPSFLVLPGGDHVHGVTLGEAIGATGYRLVRRYGARGDADGVAWDGEGIVRTFAVDVAALAAERVAEAWRTCAARNEGGAVEITTSAGTHFYGTDATTQDNIAKLLIGVLAGVMPNPRPWTPKNALAPVMLTHADLMLVGATLMARVDANIQAYLTHKAYLLNPARTRAEIEARDLTAGWPA